MTITPLPQVAGFDTPIVGGFWAPTDTQRPSLAKGLLQHSQGHRPWKGSNRKTHLANGHSQQSRVVTTALTMAVGLSGLCGSVQFEYRFSHHYSDLTMNWVGKKSGNRNAPATRLPRLAGMGLVGR
jgi:hypothetical protein